MKTQKAVTMFVFALLKTIVFLFLVNAFSSSAADDVTACRDVCDVISRHFPICFLRCAELRSKDKTEEEDRAILWNPSSDLQYLSSSSGAISSRDERAKTRSNQMANNFVRYGRDDARASQARRPVYIRVGRSPGWWNDPEQDSKRASRFVRIGKAGTGFGELYDQADFEKRNYIQPSKYVRIGRSNEEATASAD